MAQPIATLRQKCSYCGADAVEKKRRVLGKKLIITLECGHVIFQQQLATTTLKAVERGKTQEELEIEEAMKYASSDGKHAYPYQIRSTKFFEACGLNGICAHEMGVGKMVIECLLLKRNEEEITPTLFVVKSGLRYQAWLEIFRWAGIIAQIIESGRELPYTDTFPVVIISYDTLRLVRPDVTREWEMNNQMASSDTELGGDKLRGKSKKKHKEILWTDEICAQFKHIVMDECQMIKNPDASRTRAIKKIASAWQRVEGGKAPRIMGMSGTPIKNDASEYATILHMVNPTMFPSETGFIARDCYPIGSGNRFKLRDPDRFHEKTKGFIQRYTREEVLPELPRINRMFLHAELGGDALDKYKDVVKEFQDFMDKIDEISMRDMTNILGYFSRMRRITGGAKVDAGVEFTEEFLLSTDRKIVIFVHHKDTGSLLYQKLQQVCQDGGLDEPLMLVSSLSMQQRQEVVNQFKGVELERVVAEDGSIQMVEKPTGKNHRILIASTLAAGEGLNLQFCADCMIMERQWNPANEEQAEARFPRPGQLADKISVTYLIAAGSIDDFLTELVERKRSIVHSTLDNIDVEWDESSLIKDLAHTLQVKGLKKWSV